MLPKLEAWHDYVYRERTRDGEGLAEVWHPWETGMDNSPLWDEPLARIALAPEDVPVYRRVDTDLTEPSERPTNADYDRYAYLVGLFREHRYDARAIREKSPFVVQAVIFNSLLVQSNRDLAELARVAGGDPAPHEARAEQTAEAMNARLWDDASELYADFDFRADELITTPTAGSFTPLYAGVPSRERAELLVGHLDSAGVALGAHEWALASLPPDDPALRADALLARPDLADHELVPLPRARPLRLLRARAPRTRNPRRAATALRFLGALQPGERQRPRRRPVLLDRRAHARRAL